MEQRLIELETRIAFQEHTIEMLNKSLTQQQQQIDALEKTQQHFKNQLKHLTSSVTIPEAQELPPPHY